MNICFHYRRRLAVVTWNINSYKKYLHFAIVDLKVH